MTIKKDKSPLSLEDAMDAAAAYNAGDALIISGTKARIEAMKRSAVAAALPPGIEIGLTIDKSSSMSPFRCAVIEGVNRFISSQQLAGHRSRMTLMEFSNECRVVYDGVPVEEIRGFDEYFPRGSTALLDGIGTLIDGLGSRWNERDKVLCAIMTDGGENASERYTLGDVVQLVTYRRGMGWEFVFLGADDKSVRWAKGLGIENSFRFDASWEGIAGVLNRLTRAAHQFALGNRVWRLELGDRN